MTETTSNEFWCDNCERWQPNEAMVGDDAPICQSCQEDRLESYSEAFHEQAGRPLEAVDALVRGWRK